MLAIPNNKILCRINFVSPRPGHFGQMCRHLAVAATCRRHVGDFLSQAQWRLSLIGVPPPLPPRYIAVVAVTLQLHHPSPSITVAVASLLRRSAAVVATHHRPLLLIPSLVGCCIVFRRQLLSSHTVMRPLTLTIPAAFPSNCRPPPPPPSPPQVPLPPGRHHRGQIHHRTLTKKEASAALP